MVAAYDADGTPSTLNGSDRAALKKKGAAADANYQSLYEAGKAYEDPPANMTGPERAAYESGRDERLDDDAKAAAPKPAASSSAKAPAPKSTTSSSPGPGSPAGAAPPSPVFAATPPKPSSSSGGSSGGSGGGFQMGHQGAGFLLGLVAYAVVINYLRYGPAGVTAWLSAKFINTPASNGNGSGSGSGTNPSSLIGQAAAPGVNTKSTAGSIGGGHPAADDTNPAISYTSGGTNPKSILGQLYPTSTSTNPDSILGKLFPS